MSNIGQLKTVVKSYLQVQASTELVLGEGVNLNDTLNVLILQAANNARRAAEMQHDFQLADVTLTGTIPTSGVGLNLSTLVDGTETVVLKALQSVCKRVDNVDVPMRFESKQRMTHRLIERADRNDDETWGWSLDEYGLEQTVLVHGWKLFLYPESSTDISVVVDGSRWLADYVDDYDTDFILQFGFAYMQWATIVEVNHLLQTFVPRQEGSLSPPEKLRDKAFLDLVQWDSYMRESGRNIILD